MVNIYKKLEIVNFCPELVLYYNLCRVLDIQIVASISKIKFLEFLLIFTILFFLVKLEIVNFCPELVLYYNLCRVLDIQIVASIL
jgi:hypothetical protein